MGQEYLRVPLPMKRTGVKVGATLRVVKDRWDASPGTLAQVESVGYVGTSPRTWYFQVRWLIPKATRWGKLSTNLFAEDLGDFELEEPMSSEGQSRFIANPHESGH